MKHRGSFLVTIILVSIGSQLFSQNDTISDSISRDDSLNRKLSEFTDQIRKSEQQRVADSIRRLDLQRELELVKASDYIRRQELQNRISQLEQGDSIRLAQKKKRVEEILQSSVGFPVAPFGDTIFLILNKIGPFTPLDRVESINNKIRQLYKGRPYYPDSLLIVENEATYDLVYRDRIIMSISDLDALIQGTSQRALASKYREAINKSVLDHIKQRSLASILIRIGLVLLIIGVVTLLIFLLNRLFRFTKRYILSHQYRFIRSFRFRNYEFLSREKVLKGILWFNTVVKIFFFVLVVYLALPSLFSVFPVTESWADTLLRWVIDPIKAIVIAFVNYLPDLITIIVIFTVVRYLVKLLKYLTREVEARKLSLPGFHPDWARPTFGIVRFVLYAFMFVIIFPYLPGSDSDIFKGVSVFLGILISLGSSSAISNVVAGLVITYMRPFKIGDRIKIGEVTGDVIEKTTLVIRVRTIKNEEITIPNSQILTSHTINYSTSAAKAGLILHTTVTIGYDVPWKKVHELLIGAAKTTTGIDQEKDPFVLQTSLDDSYVSYQLNAYTKQPEKSALIYSDLHQYIQDKFNEAGVEIMSPHYRAVRDGNQATIPPDYLPADYSPPYFRVDNPDQK
ncbi:MAG: mechanosensitive ion channel family protein [Bacteroidetes bacterium]|nr:MAG: mechanosensitive ion channel family protein [Bacteroidota bacterium]